MYDALQMLQTSYLNLVITHGPNRPGSCFEGQVGERNAQTSCGDLRSSFDPGDDGLAETWRALELTVNRKLVRAIGVSDHSVAQLEALLRTAMTRAAEQRSSGRASGIGKKCRIA